MGNSTCDAHNQEVVASGMILRYCLIKIIIIKKFIITLTLCVFTFGISYAQLEIPNGNFELGTSGDLDNWDLTSGQAQVRNFFNLNGPNGTITVEPQSGDRLLL